MFRKEVLNYDIQLDHETIFLPFTHQNELPASITGKFCLTLTRPACFKGIKARLVGTMRTPRYGILIANLHKEMTFEKTQTLVQPKPGPETLTSFILESGEHEFPFEIPLMGTVCETLTGPGHEYHSYRLEIIIQRPLRRAIILGKPVRIYRVPQPNPRELSSNTIEGTSPQNIHYHFSIPDTFIRSGSTFPVECWFLPLRKDVTPLSVAVRVLEKHKLSFAATAAETVRYNTYFITSSAEHLIVEESYESGHERITYGGDAVDGWQMSLPVRLPRVADACSQSFRSKSINISHSVVVEGLFRDNTGHVVEVTQTVPIYIYMAADDALVGEETFMSSQELCDSPPVYGRHELDRMPLA
ncbi:uncharacterized protein BJX67DRAFT_392116 [Aspergillus lucknowensis]|uniref:Arrestin C-terminal-like domain-containing protein n=1 Tax=Aspergillus lucknowensis TaxID=176173 RepID=A0ABR4M221_9EURO